MPNKLAESSSPYLQQHANNPVNWYSWGEEAFRKAKEEDKPVFLSIGYSTCHWCHVMAEESFEDEEVAEYLNEHFVSIKVDREERPDIDQIYMKTCQMMTGSGGWPLSIFLTPDQEPFFAGTYFPKNPRRGRIGFPQLLQKMNQMWENERDKIETSSREIISMLEKTAEPDEGEVSNEPEGLLQEAYDQISEQFDESCGGFGQAPKFPAPHMLIYLLRFWNRTGEEEALSMVEETLDAMRHGGVYDQVGFGFHRYSTDREWLLPHFEKMLYDQALHLQAYTEAYQGTGNSRYRETATEIVEYLRRDMRSPEGAFYSAEDADTEGEEGKFYVWSEDELEDHLTEENASLAKKLFHTKPNGNYQEESTGKRTGKNVLHLKYSLEKHADQLDVEVSTLRERLETIRKRLLDARSDRIRPGRDEKILTDWNGLMLAALSRYARVVDSSLEDDAEQLAEFLISEMKEDETLYHRFRDGDVGITGKLDDYAFLTYGLLELYRTTFNPEYLERARELTDLQISEFWDEEQGNFYFTGDQNEDLIVRVKDLHDGALPSGNSVSLLNLVTLHRLTGDEKYRSRAQKMSDRAAHFVEGTPQSFAMFLTGLKQYLDENREVVLSGNLEELRTSSLYEVIQDAYLPDVSVLHLPADQQDREQLEGLVSFVSSMDSTNSKPEAHVCTDFACEQPTSDPGELKEQLNLEQ